MSNDILIDTVWHWQLGWLRRPEADTEDGYCYEEPDGDLVFSAHPLHKKCVRLCVWEETETGERYTTLSKTPAPTPPSTLIK